jgi:hypothetical protein
LLIFPCLIARFPLAACSPCVELAGDTVKETSFRPLSIAFHLVSL